MSIEYDFTEGLDPTPLGAISASQLLQMIRNALPNSNRGGVVWSATAPDVINNPHLVRYIWLDQSSNPPVERKFNSNTSSWEPNYAAPGSINTASLQDNSVTTAKIVPGAVNTFLQTNNAGNVVWAAFSIADGSVVIDKIDKGVANNNKFLHVKADGSAVEWLSLDAVQFIADQALTIDKIDLSQILFPERSVLATNEGIDGLVWAQVKDLIADKTLAISKIIPNNALSYLLTNAGGNALEWATLSLPSVASIAKAWARWNTPSVDKTITNVVDAVGELLTVTAHGMDTGQCFMVRTVGGTLPTSSPQITENTAYYANVVDANTISIHLTKVDAVAGTNKVDLTGDGVGTNKLNYVIPSASLGVDGVCQPSSAGVLYSFEYIVIFSTPFTSPNFVFFVTGKTTVNTNALAAWESGNDLGLATQKRVYVATTSGQPVSISFGAFGET